MFLSRCGGKVSEAIDLEKLAAVYSSLATVQVVDDFYDPDGLDRLLSELETKSIDSLVLAGGSPYSFRETRNAEQIFRSIGERGIERNRVEVVNLQNMVVRPNGNNGGTREALFEKARMLINVGLEKVRISQPVETIEIPPRKSVAIVGGTASSIIAAQHLLEEGYKVALLYPGTHLDTILGRTSAVRPSLAAAIRHPRFRAIHEAVVSDFFGYPGDFTLRCTSRGEPLQLAVGAVILSLDLKPSTLREIQSVFHLDIDEGGHILARDEVTARSQTEDRGVFIINPPRGQEGDLAAATLAADAAAAQVINLLNRNEILHRVTVSRVDAALCGGCGVCVKTCMFNAVSLAGNPPVSVIDPRRCRGCGNCVTACPAEARDLVVCPNDYLSKAVDILAKFRHATPTVLLMACDGCGYRCLDHAAEVGMTWPVGVLPLWVVCGGQIDTQLIMQAFVRGFDGVALAICGEGCCHNLIGNVDLERRANLFRQVLTSRGIDQARLHIVSTCSRGGSDCVRSINSFCAGLPQSVKRVEPEGTVEMVPEGTVEMVPEGTVEMVPEDAVETTILDRSWLERWADRRTP